VKTPLRTLIASLALTVAVAPALAGPADAASKHRSKKPKRAVVVAKVASPKKPVAARPAAAATPAPATTARPAVTSVISIGGYVFYNVTYAEAVEAYAAAVAAAPPGYTPPPVTSISVDVPVGGTVG
jgi:hypothetical protein